MARGWESKSVENQIDDSHSEQKDHVTVVSKGRHINRPLTPFTRKGDFASGSYAAIE